MKLSTYIGRTSPDAAGNSEQVVYVTKEPHNGTPFNGTFATSTSSINEAARLAETYLNGGFTWPLTMRLFETLRYLGQYDTDTKQIDISARQMFLVTGDCKQFNWLANEGRFETVADLEQFLAGLGMGALQWDVVLDEQFATVMTSFTGIEKELPQVVIILEDGSPVGVQVGGCPANLVVRVYNKVHSDDIAHKDEDAIKVLICSNGFRHEDVEDVTPDVQRFESGAEVAQIY